MYWRRSLTRLEAAVYACVAALLIGAFLERAWHYMEIAERSAVDVTVHTVNTGLRLRLAANLVARRALAEAAPPANPFALADVAPPPNFLGEVDAVEDMQDGAWLFDRVRRELVYLPRYRRGLVTPYADGSIRFAFVREPTGAWVLAPAQPYRWE